MEVEAWREFYLLYPFDDVHRYYRPAALVSAALSSGNTDVNALIKKRIDWLQPAPLVMDASDADIKTIAALGGRPPPSFFKARTE